MKEDEASMTKNDAVARSSPWALAVMVALAIVHPGCGGDSGTGSSGSNTFTNTVNNVGVLQPAIFSFTATRNGTADVEVNWNNGGNDIDIYATGASCPDIDSVVNGACQIIVSEESSTLKPERFSFGVSSGGSYKVWALNFGPGTESITGRITIR
jgi:hypothetical protein